MALFASFAAPHLRRLNVTESIVLRGVKTSTIGPLNDPDNVLIKKHLG
jgi:hypothetical protein